MGGGGGAKGWAHVSDGLIAEAAARGEALEVAFRAEGGSVLLKEAASSQGHGTATANEVLRVPSAAQRGHHLRVGGKAWVKSGPWVAVCPASSARFTWRISSFLFFLFSFYHLPPFTHFSPPTLRGQSLSDGNSTQVFQHSA